MYSGWELEGKTVAREIEREREEDDSCASASAEPISIPRNYLLIYLELYGVGTASPLRTGTCRGELSPTVVNRQGSTHKSSVARPGCPPFFPHNDRQAAVWSSPLCCRWAPEGQELTSLLLPESYTSSILVCFETSLHHWETSSSAPTSSPRPEGRAVVQHKWSSHVEFPNQRREAARLSGWRRLRRCLEAVLL